MAYNYLSSSIAQAFAALIAFTVVVHVYKIGKRDAQLKNIANIARIF